MRSYRSKQFDKLLAALPADAQRQAEQAYQQFKKNPRHPGLQFKAIDEREPPTYSARVGAHYRAVGILKGDEIVWYWIGTHEAYNKLF